MGATAANVWSSMAENPARDAAWALNARMQRCREWLVELSRSLFGESAPDFSDTLQRYELAEAIEMEQTMFCYGASVLALRLMRADGDVNSKERQSFLALFTLAGMGKEKLASLLAAAAKDRAPTLQYARQLNTLLEGDEELRQELLLRLARLALADGPMEREEFFELCRIGRALGLPRIRVALLSLEADGPLTGAPQEVLRVPHGAAQEQIQAAYRERMRHTHPDRWQGVDGCEELYRLATLKSAAVNEAYQILLPKVGGRRT